VPSAQRSEFSLDQTRNVAQFSGVTPVLPIAAGENGIWVANLDDDSVSQINPRTRDVVGTTAPRPVSAASMVSRRAPAACGSG
jgi:hypothetical protein